MTLPINLFIERFAYSVISCSSMFEYINIYWIVLIGWRCLIPVPLSLTCKVICLLSLKLNSALYLFLWLYLEEISRRWYLSSMLKGFVDIRMLFGFWNDTPGWVLLGLRFFRYVILRDVLSELAFVNQRFVYWSFIK